MRLDLRTLLPVPAPAMVRGLFLARRALHALADAITPAELVLVDHMSGIARTELVGVAAALGLAERLSDGPKSAAELARELSVDADALHRVLRALAALRLLRRDGERFAGTRLLSGLRAHLPQASHDFALYWASRSNVSAWSELLGSVRSGDGAFERVHGRSIWAWFDEHPEERDTFARAMGGLTHLVAPLVARRYPWSELGSVCDVGGGRGMLLSEILQRHPHLRGILCDAPGVLDTAGPLLEARGVSARVELAPGSFFERVPEGADAYLLKNILHDWDDARSRRILGVCRAAMRPGARVLVVEMLLERDSVDPIGTLSDLQMMVACDGGRERGVAELRALLEASGFALGRVLPHPLSAIVEGIAR